MLSNSFLKFFFATEHFDRIVIKNEKNYHNNILYANTFHMENIYLYAHHTKLFAKRQDTRWKIRRSHSLI